MDGIDISVLLPPSLLLPPRLSAHKYLMVCTLTVAAWDTLVLSPRAYRLWKQKEWPLLKITFHILRVLMPIEFTVVAVAFFDSSWSLGRCQHFYLFEPIVTACLMTIASLSLAVRLYAIWDKSSLVLGVLGSLLFLQVVMQAVSCAFYEVVPLKVGQGCIAGPKHNWVGIYWLAPTLFHTATLVFAVMRSMKSQAVKPVNLWKLFLRDGLNLYTAIWLINMINMLFWFSITPTGSSDTIKTIVTSMAAVLTTTMTLRVILGVRGSLAHGGTYTGMSSSHTHSSNHVSSRLKTDGPQPSANSAIPNQLHLSAPGHTRSLSIGNGAQTYTIEEMRAKAERDWAVDGSDHDDVDVDGKRAYVIEGDDADTDRRSDNSGHQRGIYGEKATLGDEPPAVTPAKNAGGVGVKVIIDREFQ